MSQALLLITLLAQVVDDGPTHVERVLSVEMYDQISRPDRTRPDIIAATKFIVPATADPDLLTPVYQNTNLFRFHLDFMREIFPERFATFSLGDYRRIVEQRDTRRYYAGTILRLLTRDGDVLYGFDFYTDASSDDELPRPDEVDWVYRRLTETFDVADLAYSPIRSAVIEEAKTWQGTAFSIYVVDGGALGNYTAYKSGTNYGHVRRFSLLDLRRAEQSGRIDWRDVVIVDEAPSDLTAPVACVITGTAQTELSHLNLRLAQRGTPNAFVADIDATFGSFDDGDLIRVDVTSRQVEVARADLETAEEFWRDQRPRLPTLPTSDLDFDTILSLDEIASDPNATARFGAKAKNLALLRTVLPPENVVDGFAVPLSWYERFMSESRIADPIGGDLVSYAEYFDRHVKSELFRANPSVRQAILGFFVSSGRVDGRVPDELVTDVLTWIRNIHGEGPIKVRFRSSSNLEDSVPFNGAGLYDSISVCPEDNIDDDGDGPSLCDPTHDEERTLEHGFRRVWSSLWLPRAFNERDFWQVPYDTAKMGVLVTPTFDNELANGVVLSGNPAVPGDNRILINVQIGENSVVNPESGELPEKILVEATDGVVTRVDRVRPSTLSADGEWILSIDGARKIGELVSSTVATLGPNFETTLGDILLDLEFKVIGDEHQEGRIVFKQMRPFLRPSATDVTLSIVVPEDTEVCGVFVEDRSLATEYSLLSQARLTPGRLEFPGLAGSAPGAFIEEIRVGPQQTLAVPVEEGRFSLELESRDPGINYKLKFEQDFDVDGNPLSVEVVFPTLWSEQDPEDREAILGETEIVVDEDLLSSDWEMTGELGSPQRSLFWQSCTYPILSEFQSSFRAESGETAVLTLRHRPPNIGTGEENLLAARVALDGNPQDQTDYWGLVYAADHHNWNRRFWVFLPSPVGEIAIVELREPTRLTRLPARFLLLNDDFEVVRELEGVEWSRTRLQDPEQGDFIRGDADGDHRVTINDSIHLLRFLFVRALLYCHDAGDVNDDGLLNLSDPIRTLLFLFRDLTDERFKIPCPGPFDCGRDRVEDTLPNCDYEVSGCRL